MATARKRTVRSSVRKTGDTSTGKVVGLHAPAQGFLAAAHPAVRSDLMGAALLSEARTREQPLSKGDRLLLIDQALVLLEDNYVHLPLKQAMHAVRPVQRLKLLRQRIESTNDADLPGAWAFHQEMLEIFTSVRDLHTNYILPDPFQRMTAFLPFLVEGYVEDGRRHYLVSHVMSSFDEPPFAPGVELVAWNGIAMDRAVELNADRFAGSNDEARRSRGVERLTVRPLITSLPPDEDWVIVTYRTGDGTEHELRVDWLVLEGADVASLLAGREAGLDMATGLGVDVDAGVAGQARKILFAPQAVADDARRAAGQPVSAALEDSRRPEMSARVLETAHGRFGYIRIWTFAPVDPDEDFDAFLNGFIGEFGRLLEVLPPEGLILDVRGNGGGIITAGEGILQMLTPRRIEPERLQFTNTPLNLDMCRRWGPGSGLDLSPWVTSLEQAVQTGAVYSQAFPITGDAEANAIGQRYHGPVVLITDARCYSTTDIFAAGFQDHEIGPVLGVDLNTGAGGANVWTHDLLSFLLDPQGPGQTTPYRPLPQGLRMRVAIRRNLRVGAMAGTPLEDLGVMPDEHHPPTRNDLLNGNADLFDRAGALLAGQAVRQLRAEVTNRAAAEVSLRITARGLTRLDVYADDRPVGSLDVSDGTTDIAVAAANPGELLLEGFAGPELVAIRRLTLA